MLNTIQKNKMMIGAQSSLGYASDSSFHDALLKIIDCASSHLDKGYQMLNASYLDTPLGSMLAIADNEELYLLEFVDRKGLKRQIEQLCQRTKSAILPGTTDPILSIEAELASYFKGLLTVFETPIHLLGTSFQKAVWQTLSYIPYGETRSYQMQATMVGKPLAYRAVANANAANKMAIIIPCHRVINSDGKLGGYGNGLQRKQWLLQHEDKHG